MVSKRISELPAAADLDGTEQIPLTQSGETRRIGSDTYQETRREAAQREISGIIDIEPAVEETATVAAASQGDTTLTDTSKSWTTDEHVGKWAEVKQNSGGETHYRARIVGNTSDTLTLEYGLPYNTDADIDVDLRTPLERFYLADRTVLGDGSSPTIDIRYVKEVVIERCSTPNAGGNGIAVRQADRVRIIDHEAEDPGAIGVLVYNSDDVRVGNPTVSGFTSGFGAQLKDCRDGKIIGGTARDATTAGDHGFNIKSSGIHRTFDCAILDVAGENVTATAAMTSIQQEGGTEYAAERFKVDGVQSTNCTRSIQNPYTAGVAATGEVANILHNGGQTAGLIQWPGMQCRDITVRDATLRGLQISGDDVVVDRLTTEDNNQDGTARAEVEIDGASGVVLRNPRYLHHKSASASDTAVRELNGASGTRVENGSIEETVGSADGYTVDYDLTGSGSTAWTTEADTLANSTAERRADVYSGTFPILLDAGEANEDVGSPTASKFESRLAAWFLSDGVDERIIGNKRLPPEVDGYRVQPAIVWGHSSTATGNVEWQTLISTHGIGTTVGGGSIETLVVAQGSSGVLQETDIGSPITLQGTRQFIGASIRRRGDSANDDFSAGVFFVGLRLKPV